MAIYLKNGESNPGNVANQGIIYDSNFVDENGNIT